MSISIRYEDDHILIADKPAGMLTHASAKLAEKNLLKELNRLDLKPVNRLDFHTAGLVLFGKNAQAVFYLNQLQRSGGIQKKYQAIALGLFPEKKAEKTAYLLKDDAQGRVWVTDEPNPDLKPIITRYRVIDEYPGLSLIEIELVTGRTHQIRAHMALLGHPILGDPFYGNPLKNRQYGVKTQVLIASSLTFIVPRTDHFFHYLDTKTFSRLGPSLTQYKKNG
ncbi:MAG: RluA family pseudouridine synthase [Candidatus Izemoplasmatales bacterium]|jgi:23S rRNA pseudouridine955/2504/2580 synthase|nr:RluA family pseudouridine synthase [Candidatus Izemoplasmatales bacterium]MDD4988777.1 RluA family pseudouridine synthase [Candidatus Izemoplasmatales bacterium]NLF48772.1 RluA family pseudouridine synthase [Acholeplasmataceae bacterium]